MPTARENGGPTVLSIVRPARRAALQPAGLQPEDLQCAGSQRDALHCGCPQSAGSQRGLLSRGRLVASLAAAGTLAVVLTAAAASTAWASGPTMAVDAGSDGSCATRPATYPADGEPVPDDAACSLLTDDAAGVVGEVWAWADADSVQWYSYAAAFLGAPLGGSVVMCGSLDDGEEGAVYSCSPDSTYLLFTVAGVFVEWPTSLSADLSFCQLTTFGEGSAAVLGRACGTVDTLRDGGVPPGDGGTAETSPSPTPTASEVPTEPAPSPSATPSASAPAQGTGSAPGSPVASDPPTDDDGTTANHPSVTAAPSSTPGLPSEGQPTSNTDAGGGPQAPVTTQPGTVTSPVPLESQSVARVGGSPVPMRFLLVLAGALALGGYLMLAGPGLLSGRLAARRQGR